MEARIKKYRELSPERAIVWTEKSPKYKQYRRVSVVYYLCRNHQLDHPHFMEVPISSPKGLYLKDVTNRLNALRGMGMSSLYSWSSKRSYKNGFVWHNLCEDDLILPCNGNEYVLKGSEYFEESNSGNKRPERMDMLFADHLIPAGYLELKNAKQSPQSASSTNFIELSSSSSVNGKNSKHYQDDFSPPVQGPSSSDVSTESTVEKSFSSTGSLTLTEYKIYKNDGLAYASTQTEKYVSHQKAVETCTMGVSTDEGSSKPASSRNQHIAPAEKEVSENCEGEISPPSSSSSSSSSGKTDTLESLIKADESKMNSFRIPEEEDVRMMPNAKFSATDVLMQLISCGSISVKDNSFGLIPTYKPRFNHSKLQSPLLSTSIMLGEIDYLLEKPRLTDLGLEDKEYLSGSLIETNKFKQEGDGVTDNALKRSSAYNANRCCKQLGSSEDKEEAASGRSRCMPLSIRASVNKHPQSGSMRYPVSNKPRVQWSRDGKEDGRTLLRKTVEEARFPYSMQRESDQIGRKLCSGARIIIQSKA